MIEHKSTEENARRDLPAVARATAGAGVLRLFDREPPADYVKEWTNRINQVAEKVEQGELSALIFRIGSEWLALPTAVVQEVMDVPSIHSIPHRHGAVVLGLVNVRGELLVGAALGKLLNLDDVTDKDTIAIPRLLVTKREMLRAAFPVDEVHGVVRYQRENLRDVPTTFPSGAATYTVGLLPWHDKTVGCLDDALLFYALEKSFS